ncbi:MAG: alpha/beta fold hydrolase [Planctomycetes bacterium]|nr:alpha/beta fold hydrolase [Planctomycetota bacterium]
MIWLLVFFLVVELGIPVALWCVRDRLVFFPDAEPTAASRAHVVESAGGTLVSVRRPDGRLLAAYELAAPELEPTAPVVLFLHGNAGNLALRAELAVWLARGLQVRLLMLDYSGYGENEGTPSEAELELDALAAYDHLRAAGHDAGRIALFGESLGGALALAVAAQRPCAGVIVQSSFASLAAMARAQFPWLPLAALLARGAFPSEQRARALRCPLLVVHGTRDELVPFAQGERLHAAAGANAELLTLEGAGHNDVFERGGKPYLDELRGRLYGWMPSAEPR